MNQSMNSVITVPTPGRGNGGASPMQSIPAQMTQTIFVKLLSVQ
jgi:hypothetical protein